MNTKSKAGMIGFGLIGLGCGLTAIGIAIVVPVFAGWTRGVLEEAFRKGKEGVICGVESAATTVGEVAGKAQQKFGEAAKAARQTTARVAGSVETAARKVREQAS